MSCPHRGSREIKESCRHCYCCQDLAAGSSDNELIPSQSLCSICNQHLVPPEQHILKDAMLTDGLRSYIDFHDIEGRKYYRSFKGFTDFDVLQRLAPYNLCTPYPSVTVRYFAANWPEYCILAFTDTHIPVGIIMAYPEEPLRAKITMLAVSNILTRRNVNRTLLNLECKKLKEGGIKEVVLSAWDKKPKKLLFEIFPDFEPFLRMNVNGEYYWNI